MDKFFYFSNSGEYILKIVGKATMKNAKIFTEYIEENFSKIKTLVFEMSLVEYMDSTFLGVIAEQAINMKTVYNKNLIILNPNKEVLLLLNQTGIDKFLDILFNENKKIETLIEILGDDFKDNLEKSKYILEKHEILMKLNKENELEFKELVENMRKVIK